MSWAHRWSMFWSSTQRFGRDSVHLMSSIARAPTLAASRDILLRQAREANSLATSLLRLEKEYGLLRYHGLQGYVRQWTSATMNTGINTSRSITSITSSDNIHNNKQSNTARVAFMITAVQKKELTDRLGFSTEQIKRLTPMEASLILQNSLPATEFEAKLPQILTNHHAAQQEETKKKTQQTAAIVSAINKATEATPDDHLQIDERSWFEVVERKAGGDTETVGLYTDEAEAQICIETKEQLQSKHKPEQKHSFEIRKIRK